MIENMIDTTVKKKKNLSKERELQVIRKNHRKLDLIIYVFRKFTNTTTENRI